MLPFDFLASSMCKHVCKAIKPHAFFCERLIYGKECTDCGTFIVKSTGCEVNKQRREKDGMDS